VGCRATSLAKARESLKDVAGLELVELDTDKPETVSSAFRGIQLALLVPPSERRVQVANAYVDAAAQARLSFIIVTSTIVGTNESLILGRQWKEIRTCIAASGLPYCFLELPFCLEHLVQWIAPSVKQFAAFSYPIAPQMQFPYITLRDVGLAAAYVLTQYHSHIFQTYSITAPDMISCAELAKTLSQALGKEIVFREVSTQEFLEVLVRTGLPRWVAIGLVEFWRQAAQARCISSEHFSFITGMQAQTISTWISQRSVLEKFR